MNKRIVSIITAVFFIFTLLPVFNYETKAYQNNSYFQNLKIGLISMSSTSISLTLNGGYVINGQAYASGSVVKLALSGTSLTVDGVLYTQVELTPADSSCLLSVTSGTVTNKYMGSFLFKVSNAKILPINTIDMENYLKGVVGYEMSDYFPIEALKSQAVAARNYALLRIGDKALDGYDFDDTITYQVYKGYNSIYKNVISAVDQTRGQVLLYNDKLIDALYSATHGGISENSENVWGQYIPYLRSNPDSFDNIAWRKGNVLMTNADVFNKLVSKGYLSSSDTFVKLDLNSITRYPSGRVSNITVIYKDSYGVEKSKSFTKDQTRTFLSLPSNLYNASYDITTSTYTFSGKGEGHGLGMSQIGAQNRANSGQTSTTILGFYYQNAYLQNLIQKAFIISQNQSSESLLAGNTIEFNTTAGGGNGYGYLYKYIVKNGEDVVFVKDFNSNPQLLYTPITEGNYSVETLVKDVYSISEFDASQISSFTVFSNSLQSNFTADRTETIVGQPISTDINVQGGSGSYQYKYQIVKDGIEIVANDFSANTHFTFTPDIKGTYTVTAFIKDSLSVKDYDEVKSLQFTAFKPEITAATATSSFFIGKNVTISAVGTGASNQGLLYKFEVFKNGQLMVSSDFSNVSSITYLPSVEGTYTIKVYGKDSISFKDYDCIRQFDIFVNPKPLYLGILPLSYGMTNNDVLSLQDALSKLGYFQGTPNAYFGKSTKQAVVAFQKANSLSADGIVGNITYRALNEELINKSGVKTLYFNEVTN